MVLVIELSIQGLIFGAQLAIAGLGFAVIYYTARELHFAYGILVVAAGYLGYALVVTVGLAVPIAVILVVLISAIVGMGVHRWLYKPLNDHLAVVLIALGFSIILENGLLLYFGPSSVILPGEGLGIVAVGEVFVQWIGILSIGLAVLAGVGLYLVTTRGKLGLVLLAVMRDPEMSGLVGIRTSRVRLASYGVGSAIAAMSGLLQIAYSGLVPSMSFQVIMFAFVVAILGNGSLVRVVLWSFAVGVFMELSAVVLPVEFQLLTVFSGMLVYLLVRGQTEIAPPQGPRPATH